MPGALLAVCSLLVLCALPARAEDLVFAPAPTVAEPTRRMLLDITRAGDRLVAVGAAGLVIVSDDSGSSWRQAPVPVSATLTAVDFPTPRLGWAVGHAGVILHSSDGGESWTLQYDGRDGNAALLAWAGERRATLEAELLVLEEQDAVDASAIEELDVAIEEAIFLEEDAQLAVDTGPADPLLDVRFFDERRGLAAGAYGALLRTEDGGESWELAIGGLDNVDRFHLYSVLLTAGEGVYIAGEAGLLFRSMDGGRRFERYWDVYDGSFFGLVDAPGGVLAFGLRGNQFRYDGNDDAWIPVDSIGDSSLYGGALLGDGTVLFTGAGGALLRRAPDGTETPQLHPSRSTLAAAAVAPDGRIWLAGMEGLVSYAEARTP